MPLPVDKNQLQIALLGPPIVKYAGQIQKIERYRTRAVLFYLAAQKVPVSRDALCARFWPNLSEKAAHKNLREILSHLRTQFADIEVIETHYDQLSLNSENSQVDVRDFQSLIDRVHFNLYAIPTGKLPESLYRELREGVSLWRTPHFMDGFAPRNLPEFDAWIVETNQELRHWQSQFLERLADHTITTGNLAEALYWIWQATQIEPLNTDLHYLALTCLRDSGKTDGFSAYMEQVEKIYKTDHNLEVPQLLTDFIARSLESKEMFGVHIGESGEQRIDPQPAFIGRKDLMLQINLWAQRGGIIYVKGESGIGKSRLLQEFYNRIDFPIRSVFCNAQAMEQNLPFQPFIDGLRSAIKPDDWQSLPQPQAEILSRLFPEISEYRPDVSGGSHLVVQNAFQAIFEAIYVLLGNMAGQKHLVLFFDDAHWADEATISLLSHLCSRGLFQGNNVLILAARNEEKNNGLFQCIRSVERRSNFQSVKLDYLNEKEIGELVYSVLGQMPPPEMVARLMREVGGNPLFLHQTLKLIMDYSVNIDSLSVMTTFPIPYEVQAVIRERIDSLVPDALAVVNICAVIGNAFTPGLVEDVCHLDRERLVQIFEQLVAMHLLNENKDVKPAGGYAFAHEKVRDSILGNLSPARARMLNLQVVEALQKRHGQPLALSSHFAQYYEAAGELKAAFTEWIHAGQHARQLFSRADSYFAYQRAFDLIKHNEGLFTIGEIHELITKWGNYTFDILDKETCEFVYQSCLDWGNQRQSPLLIGTGQSGLARVMGMRNQIPSALKRMRLALKSLEAGGWVGELIQAYARLGNLYHLANNYREAREAYEKALSLTGNGEVESRMAIEARISAQALLSILYSETGWPARALDLANQSLEASQTVHRITSRIQAYAARAIALFYTGNFREAIEAGRFVLEDASAKGTAFWQALLNSALARSYISAGFIDKAWAHLDEANRQSEIAEMPYLTGQARTIRGEIFRYLRQYPGAEKLFLSSIHENRYDFFALECIYKLGFVKISTGESAKGFELIELARSQAEKMELGMITLPAKAAMLISGCYGNGKVDDPQAFENLIREVRERGFMPLPLWLEFIKFTFDYSNGLNEDALKRLLQLLKEIHDSGNIWLELDAYDYVLKSKVIPVQFKPQARQRIQAICDHLVEHAVQEPVNEMVKDFTNEIEKSIASVTE